VKLKRTREVKAALKKVKELDPSLKGDAVKLKRKREAKAALKKAKELDPAMGEIP
jgi:hypothetical protein